MDSKLVDRFLSDWRRRIPLEWGWLQKSVFVFFFILSLAFFLHFREVRIDHLELGGVAEKYVLAQVGFDFPDIETTRIVKEESLRDIGLIYYFDDEEILQAQQKIQDDLIRTPQWRKELSYVTFDDIMHVCDTLRDTLLQVEFSDARTIQKLEQMGMSPMQYLLCASQANDHDSMAAIWTQIKKTSFASSDPVANYILEKYRTYPWNLKEDFDLRQNLRRKIKEEIPIKKTHVEAGSRIINAGDKVTRRHLDMLQEMKKVLTEQKHLFKPLTILGSVALSAMLIFLGLFYFRKFHPSLIKSFSKMALIVTIILLNLCLAKLTDYYMLHKTGYLIDFCRFPIFLLFSSLTLSILIDRGVAMIVSGFIALVLGMTLAMDSHEFMIINLSTAVMAIIWIKGVRKRKEIFAICSKIWLLTLPLVLAVNLLNNKFLDQQILADFLTTFLFIFMTAILIVAVLPLFESAFDIVTDMTLMESGDPNHPLLRRLSLEAPGTYQHSLGVATLAEEAALAIGANALQCRVSALYHDIGKVIQPHYFTENQFSGFNMHQLLTPLESAQVIIQHVTEGVKLAESYELPMPIIDVIREHHGTTLVYYFYHAQIEQTRIKTLGVEEAFFRYPGPIPQSRESAVVMIADSIEAAYRCQDDVNEKTISRFIEEIVADKIREHQLDASHLTFDDLNAIKKAIFRSLMALGHSRPKYPTPPSTKIPMPEEALI